MGWRKYAFLMTKCHTVVYIRSKYINIIDVNLFSEEWAEIASSVWHLDNCANVWRELSQRGYTYSPGARDRLAPDK